MSPLESLAGPSVKANPPASFSNFAPGATIPFPIAGEDSTERQIAKTKMIVSKEIIGIDIIRKLLASDDAICRLYPFMCCE